MDHKMTDVSQGKKLKLQSLILPLSVDDNRWLWDLVNAYGLTPVVRLGTKTSLTDSFVL